MKCTKCGKEILNDSFFCEYCGTKVQNVSQSVDNDASVSFGQAVKICLTKYAVFTGRARRSEYWWFVLFNTILSFIANFLDAYMQTGSIFSIIVALALILPGIGVAVRRCHDTNNSGWWILVPIYNLFIVLRPSTPGVNDYGMLDN